MGFLRLSVLSTLRLARKEKSRQKTDKDRTCPYLLVPSFLFVCVILTDVLYGLDIPYLNALPRCCRTYSYPKVHSPYRRVSSKLQGVVAV